MRTALSIVCLAQVFLLLAIENVNGMGIQQFDAYGNPIPHHGSGAYGSPLALGSGSFNHGQPPFPHQPLGAPGYGSSHIPGSAHMPPGAHYPPPNVRMGGPVNSLGHPMPGHGAPYGGSSMGHMSHGSTTYGRYTDQSIFTSIDQTMTQHQVQPVSHLLHGFHNKYRNEFQLKLHSKMKSNQISKKTIKKLGLFYNDAIRSNGIISNIAHHHVLRQAIMQQMGFPCGTDYYTRVPTCSEQEFYRVVQHCNGNPMLQRKLFLLVKNSPGILSNNYNVGHNFQQKFSQITQQTTTTTHVSHQDSFSNQHGSHYNAVPGLYNH